MTGHTDLRDRLEVRLRDEINLVFPTTTLDEGIRSGLYAVSLSGGTLLKIAGLDGELTTTVPEIDLDAVLIGAEVYCLGFILQGNFSEYSGSIEELGQLRLKENQARRNFDKLLEGIRKRYLQNSTDHPHGAWTFDESFSWEDDG